MTFLLREILLQPHHVRKLALEQYNQLIPQARGTNLLCALASRLQKEEVLDDIPQQVRRHLNSAMLVHSKQKRDLNYDIKLLRNSLAQSGDRLILLKGAAYLQAELPVGAGRLISDIDILVPHDRVETAEKSLNQSGWESGGLDPYTERYYRKWMHEIPPMGNPNRGTTLDLHHTILPPTAKAKVNADLLFNDVVEVKSGVYTLSRIDMVIHSATHLFHEGEFHHGLRDLWDLDRMLRDFSSLDPEFWQSLIPRARELGLLSPLFHGLTYTTEIFDTPVPANVVDEASSWSRTLRKPFMGFLFRRAFRPDQLECKLPFTELALNLLYIRSHYLRMPLYLLIPHLTRKAWKSRVGQKASAEEETVETA